MVKKHKKIVPHIIVVLSLIAIGASASFFLFLRSSTQQSALNSTPSPLPTETTTIEASVEPTVSTPSPSPSTAPTKKPVPKPSPSPSPSGSPDLNAPQREATSYTLSAGNNPQRVRVDSYPDADYAYVILKNQAGEIIRDQSNVQYQWEIANGSMVSYNLGRAPGYPCYPLQNDIKQPCPAFAAYLKGHFPGETTVYVTATIPGKAVVKTQFQVITYSR